MHRHPHAHAHAQAITPTSGPPLARLRNPLPPWQRLLLNATGWVLMLTGALWLALHYGRSDPTGEALPHALEPWALRLHGLAGFAALFVLGALASVHVPRGWRITARRGGYGLGRTSGMSSTSRTSCTSCTSSVGRAQRRWGIVLCVLAALLAASAWLLYYFAPDPVRPALGLAHSAAGVAMALALWLHRRAGDLPLPLPLPLQGGS